MSGRPDWLYAFSTLACPGWSWRDCLARASAMGYDGIEWRLLDGEVIAAAGPDPLFVEIRRRMDEAGLKTAALDSGFKLAVPPAGFKITVLDEARSMLAKAHALGAPFLRVFNGKFPPGTDDDTAVEWIAENAAALAAEAAGSGLTIALETHAFEGRGKNVSGTSDSRICARVVDRLAGAGVGILWDFGNPYLEDEPFEETLANLEGRLAYVHAKDLVRRGDGSWAYIGMGRGQLPLAGMFAALKRRSFAGWISFEWEKKWHPEIDEPELALPEFLSAMRELES